MDRTRSAASAAAGSSAPVRGRGPAALLVGCALACAAVAGTAQAAHAQDGAPLVACPGYVEQSISPGLTLLPRSNAVGACGRFGPCANQVVDPEHVFADYTASASGLVSCGVNAPITNATGTVRWEGEDGHHTGTSHFTGGITLSRRPAGENVGILVATITSSDFTGRSLVPLSARLTIDPVQCLTGGVERVAGPGALEVLPVQRAPRRLTGTPGPRRGAAVDHAARCAVGSGCPGPGPRRAATTTSRWSLGAITTGGPASTRPPRTT